MDRRGKKAEHLFNHILETFKTPANSFLWPDVSHFVCVSGVCVSTPHVTAAALTPTPLTHTNKIDAAMLLCC